MKLGRLSVGIAADTVAYHKSLVGGRDQDAYGSVI